MPDPITPPTDDTVQDDPIDVNKSGTAPSLDQVHQLNQAHVEAEDDAAAEEAGDDAGDDAGAAGDEDDAGAGDDAGDDDAGAGDDDAGAGADDTPPAPVVPEPVTPPATPPETPAAPDTDITKNGDGKVAIKDADGNTFYFNNLDEVPEDFEPASYKSLMVGTKALLVKEQNDDQAAKDAKVSEEQAAHLKATEDMQNGWEADATSMVRAGTLPNEPKKLEAVKNKVYDYIESELQTYQKTNGAEGSIQTSFSTAYKNMMYDEQQAANATKQQEINDAKKKRGGIVQGGSGADAAPPTAPRGGGRIIEAPPSGVGLDAVHAKATSQL